MSAPLTTISLSSKCQRSPSPDHTAVLVHPGTPMPPLILANNKDHYRLVQDWTFGTINAEDIKRAWDVIPCSPATKEAEVLGNITLSPTPCYIFVPTPMDTDESNKETSPLLASPAPCSPSRATTAPTLHSPPWTASACTSRSTSGTNSSRTLTHSTPYWTASPQAPSLGMCTTRCANTRQARTCPTLTPTWGTSLLTPALKAWPLPSIAALKLQAPHHHSFPHPCHHLRRPTHPRGHHQTGE